jgi:hypothetical protein
VRTSIVENKRSRLAYIGESVRETAVLLAVFGPMYLRFEARESGPALILDILSYIFCGIILLGVGIEFERRF